ncbi:family 43 glycosylhydrolase [Radiobacillus sp. PE A8.2]|uniref:family 43 glycosylhydrolase n=1 Tax=Radiobacillus sp. PE A8.2 TaxID=3380349 RepID=UPI00388E9609
MKRVIAMFMIMLLFAGSFNIPIDVEAAEPTMDGHGLMGEFFKVTPNPDDREDIRVFTFDDLRGERVISNLNGDSFTGTFNEITGSTDYNTARFTGTIVPEYTEDYTFHMVGDDGFRVWVNDELVIDFWEQKWEEPQASEPITLESGKHYDIKVEYLQGWGGSWLRMEWESASQEREIIPESALYLPIDHIISAEKEKLTSEIQKSDYFMENFADRVDESDLNDLNIANTTAKELLTTIDSKTVSDREKADLLIAATESLSIARADFMEAMGATNSSDFDKFSNPLYQGQDPFVTYKDGFYYFVSSSNLDSNNKIYVSKSRTLTDQGEKVMVFDSKGTETRIFAPEIFFLDGKWYIYYCADLKEYDYRHMATVIESVTDDPQGEYVSKGALYTGVNGDYRQANDFTVFEYNGQLYGVWGTLGQGEPVGPAIAPMDNPYTITEDRSVLPGHGGEGPRVLQKDGKVFITLSEGDYQSDGYRMSYYMNTDGDILNQNSWTRKNDVFVATSDVSGPARAGFVKSVDGKEDWMIYHSRVYKETTRNWWRQINIKKFGWNDDGTPDFGEPVSPYVWQQLPSGDLGQGDMYQAEEGIVYGDINQDDSYANFQGTGYIHLPKDVGTEANFVVDAQEAGDYIVGVRYAYGVQVDGESTSNPRTQLPARAKINVYVNGIHMKTITPDKTAISWEEWFTASERLQLKAGKNVISYRIDQDSIGNVNVDYLTMHKADVPNLVKPTITATNISINPNQSVYIDKTVQLNATVEPADYTNSIIWKSENTDVAIVNSNGMVTGKAEGTATIKATIDGQEVSTVVAVHPKPVAVTSVEINTEDGTNEISENGGILQLTAEVIPANATDQSVTWSIASGSMYATISETGLVTAKDNGTVIIKATAVTNPEITDTINLLISNQTFDVSTLEALINNAKTISNEDETYTASSFQVLQDAIVLAEQAISTIETEKELGVAITSLQKAIEGLKTSEPEPDPIDLTELEELLTITKGLTNDDGYYTQASFALLQEVITQSELALKTIRSESELQAAITSLQAAYDGLETNEPDPIDNDEDALVIDANGEFVEVAAGQEYTVKGTHARVKMPADLPVGTKVKVTKVNPNTANKQVKVSGDVLEFTFDYPSGATTPNGSFTLVLGYNEDADENLVAIYYYNEKTGVWEHKGGSVDEENQLITLEVPHFSTYGVFVEERKDEQPNTDEDQELPDTASNLFNWLLFGGILFFIGGSLLVIQRYRVRKSKE